jgi:hypothetical protein
MSFHKFTLFLLVLISVLGLSAFCQTAPSEFTPSYQFSSLSEAGYSMNLPIGFST